MNLFDIYGENPAIFFKGQLRNSSSFSIFFSLCYFTSIVVLSLYFSADIVLREDPLVTSALINSTDPVDLKISSDKLFLAVTLKSLVDDLPFVDPSVYTLIATEVTSKGDKQQLTRPLKLIRCNYLKSDLLPSRSVFDYNAGSYFCFNEPQLVLKGGSDFKTSVSIKLDFKRCDLNVAICKSNAEMDNILIGSTLIILTADVNFVPTSFSEPTPKYYKSVSLAINSSPVISLFYSAVEVLTDTGLFLTSYEEMNDIALDYFNINNRTPDGLTLAQVELKTSPKTVQHTRKYVKVQSIMADLGGASVVLRTFYFMLAKIFVDLENYYAVLSILAKAPKINAPSSLINVSQANLQVLPFARVRRDLLVVPNKKKWRWRHVCCFKKVRRYIKLRKEFGGEARKYMDVQFWVKTMNEVQVMKQLLLTNDQSNLVSFFNFSFVDKTFSNESYLSNANFASLLGRTKRDLEMSLQNVKTSNEPADRLLVYLLFGEQERSSVNE